MTLIVWSDLSSRIVTDDELRIVQETYPAVHTIALGELWSGKYLACPPEKLALERARVPHRRATDVIHTRAEWGQLARERAAKEAQEAKAPPVQG